jgi:hypothetical protein
LVNRHHRARWPNHNGANKESEEQRGSPTPPCSLPPDGILPRQLGLVAVELGLSENALIVPRNLILV